MQALGFGSRPPISYRDLDVKINNSGVYCTDASLDTQASFNPAFNTDSQHSFNLAGENYPEGTLSIEYLLTGVDPLADFRNRKNPHELYFGGFHVKSGYLSSYQVDTNSYDSLVAQASFSFYEPILGEISYGTSDLPDDIQPLNASDITIDEGIYIKSGQLGSFNYTYNSSFEPAYNVDKKTPADMVFGPERIEASAVIYNYDLSLLATGIRENYKINLNDKNGNLKQSFILNAQIGDKSISVSEGEGGIISTEIKMGQANMGVFAGEEAEITDMIPDSGDTGDLVKLEGNNFVGVEKVMLGQFPCEISEFNSTEVNFYVPSETFSGYKAPVHLITNGMRTSSPTGFLVTGGITF